MTVRELIRRLNKMPPNAKVAFCDHDQDWDRGEMNGPIQRCEEAPDAIKDRGYGVVLG